MYSEGSLCPKRFLCPPWLGLDLETSRTATARSSNSATEATYSPNEGIGEERERFWNDLDNIDDGVGNGYRLYMLGDLN